MIAEGWGYPLWGVRVKPLVIALSLLKWKAISVQFAGHSITMPVVLQLIENESVLMVYRR